MSIFEDFKKIKSTPKEYREFGVGGAIFLAAIAGILWWNHHPYAWRPLWIAGPLLLFGSVWPKALKPVYLGAMFLTLPIGWVMTRVILSLLFFLVVFPVAVIARLSGKKFLDRRFRDPKQTSYWVARTEPKQKIDYERQF